MLAIMWSSSRNAANAEQARIKARDAYQSFLMEIKTVCTRCGSVLFYGDTLNSGHNEDTVRGDVRC
jgi:hypothetical protein